MADAKVYPRDEAYRDGVLMAMQAHDIEDDHQCWYWLFLVAPIRPEWLQTARLYHAIFGDDHNKSVRAWECLFFAEWSGEFGTCPPLLALQEVPSGVKPSAQPDKGAAFREWQQDPLYPQGSSDTAALTNFDAGYMRGLAAAKAAVADQARAAGPAMLAAAGVKETK